MGCLGTHLGGDSGSAPGLGLVWRCPLRDTVVEAGLHQPAGVVSERLLAQGFRKTGRGKSSGDGRRHQDLTLNPSNITYMLQAGAS